MIVRIPRTAAKELYNRLDTDHMSKTELQDAFFKSKALSDTFEADHQTKMNELFEATRQLQEAIKGKEDG